ncbi:hypothetical protein CKO23_16610 [Thiocystis violacea]|nr:hypothetical protein [Thiocystis violacea]
MARIQAALVRLRYLVPEAASQETAVYGPQTANAVLSYKRDFDVVNRRYQTQADNVVGRMTIASLDHAIWVLDGAGGPPRLVDLGRLHPVSPRVATLSAQPVATAPPASTTRAPIGGAYKPPLSGLPAEIQAVVRRSNAAKTPGKMLLFPFVAVHEPPLDDDELSKRFAANPDSTATLRRLHHRMVPFGIWSLVRLIESVYSGTGSKGMFCAVVDPAVALTHMIGLTRGPVAPINPYLAQIKVPLTDSKFCRDAFNVHGERDSFREIVRQGEGLHICITNAIGRARTDEKYPYSDFHIDHIQQGQVCVDGFCVPIVNGQTIEHLRTVGPWLIQQPGEWLKKHLPTIPVF